MLDSLFPVSLSVPFLDFLHTLGTFKTQCDVYQSLAFYSSLWNYSIHWSLKGTIKESFHVYFLLSTSTQTF